jgi:NAD(P)H-dependent FMN reductase
MTSTPYIVGICGSLRDESSTRVALAHTLAAAEDAGAETAMIDLRDYDLPLYNGDAKNAGDAPRLREAVSAADALVLGTPIYHGTVSSTLKTALDYCGFDEFEDKPVGLLTVAGGRFPTPALLHLRTICVWLRANPLPHHVGIPNVSSAIEDGVLTDEKAAERTETLGTRLTEFTRVLAGESAPQMTL